MKTDSHKQENYESPRSFPLDQSRKNDEKIMTLSSSKLGASRVFLSSSPLRKETTAVQPLNGKEMYLSGYKTDYHSAQSIKSFLFSLIESNSRWSIGEGYEKLNFRHLSFITVKKEVWSPPCLKIYNTSSSFVYCEYLFIFHRHLSLGSCSLVQWNVERSLHNLMPDLFSLILSRLAVGS